MKLINFSINNYRGAQLAEDIPIKSMTVFVGKNDSGKSIALNAVATFLDIKTYPVMDMDFNKPQLPIILTGMFTSINLTEMVSKQIGTKIKKDEGKQEFVSDVCGNDQLAVRRIIKLGSKGYSETQVRVSGFDHRDFDLLHQKTDEELSSIITDYTIEIPVSGAGRNSKLEKIKHIKAYCLANGIPAKLTWIADDFDVAKILPEIELFKSDYGIEADTAFKTSSVTEVLGVIDEESSETGSLTSVANKVEVEMGKESSAIAALMKEYVPNIKTISITPNFDWKAAIKSVDVNFELDNDNKPINMTRKGSGYRRLFMVARFRYLAEKKKGGNVLYAIEEPETFLHPSAQEDLLIALEDLSTSNQILLATHSPVFAGSSDRSAIVLCEKTNTGSKYSTESDNIDIPNRIIEQLGIRPRHNLRDSYTRILFCESANDILFYDAIVKEIFQKSIVENGEILALPGGGDSLEDIINIDYFTKTGRNLYLLIDSDKHRDEAKQRKNVDRAAAFRRHENAKSYILNKACIENYYHPRAFERVYEDIPSGKCEFFTDSDNVKLKLSTLSTETGVQIKHKNDHRVFAQTTAAEWKEVAEPGLVEFLGLLIS